MRFFELAVAADLAIAVLLIVHMSVDMRRIATGGERLRTLLPRRDPRTADQRRTDRAFVALVATYHHED